MKKIKRIIPLVLCIAILTGCTGQKEVQVVEVPYDPYSFTPRDFLEEGGWNSARDMADEKLPMLFCDYKNIVLNPEEEYQQILTISGNSYDFENAEMKCAVFSKVPTTSEDTKITYQNRLDILYQIPYEQDGIARNTVFDVILTDITRSKDGKYNCVSEQANESLTAYLDCKDGVTNNSYFIENDSEVKEPLDYGILYCVGVEEEDDKNANYRQVYELALSLEEDRVNAYLLEHTNNPSTSFTTSDNDYACRSACYTVEFNEEEIKKDLTACAKRYGLHVYDGELPLKAKKIEKEGWSIYPVAYNTEVENGKTAQGYMKESIRDAYVQNPNYELAFLIQYDEQTKDAVINFYYREYVDEKTE